jgi:hypothetical protein
MPGAGIQQSVLVAARHYLRRGWRVVPVEPGEKRCIRKGWPDLDLGIDELPRHFNGDCNIGVVLGQKSRDLADIDLDCAEAVALADFYLPGTEAIFGRVAKPNAHRLYIAQGAQFKKFSDPLAPKDSKTILELRATGREGHAHQTLFPPSVADGQIREWAGVVIAPRVIGADQLRIAAAWLAIGCLVARYVGETPARQPRRDLPRLLFEADPVLGERAAEWLARCEPARSARQQQHSRRNFARGDLDLAELVARIPNNCDWHDWNRVGMAIFRASQGSETGLGVFDEFSARSPKYQPASVTERWHNYYRSPPTSITAGTLVYLALAAEGRWCR